MPHPKDLPNVEFVRKPAPLTADASKTPGLPTLPASTFTFQGKK